VYSKHVGDSGLDGHEGVGEAARSSQAPLLPYMDGDIGTWRRVGLCCREHRLMKGSLQNVRDDHSCPYLHHCHHHVHDTASSGGEARTTTVGLPFARPKDEGVRV
jgi:hypothetical protein